MNTVVITDPSRLLPEKSSYNPWLSFDEWKLLQSCRLNRQPIYISGIDTATLMMPSIDMPPVFSSAKDSVVKDENKRSAYVYQYRVPDDANAHTEEMKKLWQNTPSNFIYESDRLPYWLTDEFNMLRTHKSVLDDYQLAFIKNYDHYLHIANVAIAAGEYSNKQIEETERSLLSYKNALKEIWENINGLKNKCKERPDGPILTPPHLVTLIKSWEEFGIFCYKGMDEVLGIYPEIYSDGSKILEGLARNSNERLWQKYGKTDAEKLPTDHLSSQAFYDLKMRRKNIGTMGIAAHPTFLNHAVTSIMMHEYLNEVNKKPITIIGAAEVTMTDMQVAFGMAMNALGFPKTREGTPNLPECIHFSFKPANKGISKLFLDALNEIKRQTYKPRKMREFKAKLHFSPKQKRNARFDNRRPLKSH